MALGESGKFLKEKYSDCRMELTSVMNTFLVAMVSSCGVAWIISRWAAVFRVFDKPAEHKIHANPTPVLGGVAIWVGFSLSVLIGRFGFGFGSGAEARTGILIFATAAALHLLGLIDDIRTTSARFKFVGQVVIVAAFVSILAVEGSVVPTSLLHAAVTGFWILCVINSINLIDGLDGLAGGVTVIACAAFLLMTWRRPHSLAILLSVALAGSTVGFLLLNFHPAKLFMGDSGSLLLGFLLAIIPLLIIDGVAFSNYSLLVPLLVLAIPLMDMSFAFLRRFMQRQSPFAGDLGHTYNKIMDAGLSHKSTVLVFYVLSLLFGAVGLAVYYRRFTLALLLGLVSLSMVLYGTLRYRFLD